MGWTHKVTMDENPCIGCIVEAVCTKMCDDAKPYFLSKVTVKDRTVNIKSSDMYGDNVTIQFKKSKLDDPPNTVRSNKEAKEIKIFLEES